MHFRDRQRVVQVVRTTYDAATKKPKAVVVGRLEKANPVMDDELRLSLSREELAEVQAYVENLKSSQNLELEVAVRTLGKQMRKVQQWLDHQPLSASNLLLAQQIDKEAKRLHKALVGFMGESAPVKVKAQRERRKAGRTERMARKAAKNGSAQ